MQRFFEMNCTRRARARRGEQLFCPEREGLADDFVQFGFGFGIAAEGEGAGEMFPIVG